MKMIAWLLGTLAVSACSPGAGPAEAPAAVDSEISDQAMDLEEGVRMIPVETPHGTFNVWTKMVGESLGQGTVLDHAEVSPDSNLSAENETPKRGVP